MTVKRQPKRGGCATIVKRQKLKNENQEIDYTTIPKVATNYNISVGFNDKDQLQIDTKEDLKNDDTKIKETKVVSTECIKIDDIINCMSADEYPQLDNVLVFYIRKDRYEAIVIKFRNEQDYKRIYFTFKYFKMRNRLANNTTEAKKKVVNGKVRKADNDFDLKETVDSNGVTHLSVQQRSNEQPLSLIGVKINQDSSDLNETTNRLTPKTLLKPKNKPPLPPNSEVMRNKGLVRTTATKLPDKDMKIGKNIPKEVKNNLRSVNLWSTNKVQTGYDSDREEWRRSSSQFSTSAFNSLSRPTRMALTLRKIPKTNNYFKQELQPPFYQQPYTNFPRFPHDSFKNSNLEYPKWNYSNFEHFKNLNNEHKKFASLQNLDFAKKKPNRFAGLTNRIKELSMNSKNKDLSTLKPVIKKTLDNKRPVVRTCSVEPPKKVTFSAFATVQVV